uniref:4-hydroxy-tetrahydrodipicolinate reductase n=1 Tax=Megaviridae environmental sample TaxID=1737588 RepID=A0A5J6VJU2_9VIRU|nr:MAG: dihydrodipicolinate reductase [Megaviridae environmental sample]
MSFKTIITRNQKHIYINGATGKLGSIIYKNAKTYKPKSNVVIDVSSPTGLKNLLKYSYIPKIPLVIGTTGDLPMEEIKEYSNCAPVAICPNFSKGNLLLQKLCKVIPTKDWDIEMMEIHHKLKKDSPSGTAKQLCSLFGLDYKQVHCLRMNDILGEHTIYLASKGERIEIKHTVSSRDVFSDGALKVADWIIKQKNGLYYI